MKRRILSIDGGGIKGVFPAAFLARIEEATGKRIAEHFDLIAGTSTGGIIALALGLGISAAEILAMYERQGPSIFAKPQPKEASPSLFSRVMPECLRKKVEVKYGPKALRTALETTFGSRRLGESSARLLVPAYHGIQREVYVFKTSHHSRLEVDYKCMAVDVGMATAAAPTYFPAHAIADGSLLVDGGIWANNPVGLAVVEAIGVLEWSRDSLYVLSLGCTESSYSVPEKSGELQLAQDLAEIFLQGQSKGALGTAKLITGHTPQRRRLFRYQPVVPHGTFELDGIAHIDKLRGLGAAEARSALPDIREVFLDVPAERFTPFHSEAPRTREADARMG